MQREYYSNSIANFLDTNPQEILGILADSNEFALEQTQRDAWKQQIVILQDVLLPYRGQGSVCFEYSIPRMGQRIDVVAIIGAVIFVLEFKVGEKDFPSHAIDQVWDYALDLKNFHESSHDHYVAPVLIATKAKRDFVTVATTPKNDKLLCPINSNTESLGEVIENVLLFAEGETIDYSYWKAGRYCPTPTIIESAMALYNGHNVEDISRSDASAINLRETSQAISNAIEISKQRAQKTICFVTGVPGAGKTLVGLNIATTHIDEKSELYSVFLSGNAPLVMVLREALVRDKVEREKARGNKIKKGEAFSEIKAFIQNVHHFRDDCLVDTERPPIEHVALFDEAQRAWTLKQTSNFMKNKKKMPDFNQSEPDFLISCLDRHDDWAVVVCLVGGGQEINTGEAGIAEWIKTLQETYPDWHIHLSPKLTDSEYGSGEVLKELESRSNVVYKDELHLGVSMRSFRAEHVSLLVKQILDMDVSGARETLPKIEKYPVVITRDLKKAKKWLKTQARGSERYGIVVSSQAERLRPHAIHVKSPINPIHWFLNNKQDVRSSYYLEDVATEFHVQGLELDWSCVVWDADFRFTNDGWDHRSFRGSRWTKIRKEERKMYLKNAYRVLLTRARQGMVIVVPPGDPEDPTRLPEFYNPIFEYLESIGFPVI
ncbi:MAG: DUF2075 domain-containing protein [Planctomycetes bacterium]|nr:DUF2075 domain-containing protein [Planctomycetota bacterium]